MGKAKVLAVLFAVVAVVLVLKREDPTLTREINVISTSEDVETYLKKFHNVLGADYESYRGHLYRVLTYTLHFLDGDQSALKAISAGLVYHDIAIWTDNNLAYLEPSVDHVVTDTGSIFSAEELQLVKDIIYWHHKITPFHGASEKIVNAFRKADWIDATQGLVNHGMPAAHVAKVAKAIPYIGFHDALLASVPRIYGWNIPLGLWKLSSIMKW